MGTTGGRVMAYKPCKWLDTRGAKHLTKDTPCDCQWPMPDYVLPISITKSPIYVHNPPRMVVRKGDCAQCPCYEPEGE